MYEKTNIRNLSMDCEKERPILYPIKIHAVLTACKVERADKRPFIREQCSIHKVHCLGPFYVLVKRRNGIRWQRTRYLLYADKSPLLATVYPRAMEASPEGSKIPEDLSHNDH